VKRLTKGLLIVIEGIDGAGKTTQVKRLTDHFKSLGYDTIMFKEPTDGQYGQQIRMLAKSGRDKVTPTDEFELFLKDRIEDCKLNILPALKKKKLVFMDRYYFSNIAYQGALGLDKNFILRRNEEIAPVPDLVIFLDALPKVGLNRIENFRKEEHNYFEREDYLNKVLEIFRQMNFAYLKKIDGSRDEETVFKDLKNILENLISQFTFQNDNQRDFSNSGSPQHGTVQSRNRSER